MVFMKTTGFSQIFPGCSSHCSYGMRSSRASYKMPPPFKAPLNAVFVSYRCRKELLFLLLLVRISDELLYWSCTQVMKPEPLPHPYMLWHREVSAVPSLSLRHSQKLRSTGTLSQAPWSCHNSPHLRFPAGAPSFWQIAWGSQQAEPQDIKEVWRNCVNVWWWQCKLSKGSEEQLRFKFQTNF